MPSTQKHVPSKDFLPNVFANDQTLSIGQVKLTHGSSYPLRTYKEFKEIDPFSSLLGLLAKSEAGDKIALQLLLVPVGREWQAKANKLAANKARDTVTGREYANPYAKIIQQKTALDGFKTAIIISFAERRTTKSQLNR